jgi:[ribosomal protein S5]-alanine N-acetyltransferase
VSPLRSAATLQIWSAMSPNHQKSRTAVVVGEQVYLRRPTAQDKEEFLTLNQASVRFHRSLVTPPINPTQFASFLKRCRRSDCACFFICRVADSKIIGSINLSQIFLGGFRSAYLGYFVGEQYSGQGYMTEAIQLILRFAFTQLKLHRLEANIQPDNSASQALIKRAGFVREGFSRRYLKIGGRWRDHERWAILAEDWKSAIKRSS